MYKSNSYFCVFFIMILIAILILKLMFFTHNNNCNYIGAASIKGLVLSKPDNTNSFNQNNKMVYYAELVKKLNNPVNNTIVKPEMDIFKDANSFNSKQIKGGDILTKQDKDMLNTASEDLIPNYDFKYNSEVYDVLEIAESLSTALKTKTKETVSFLKSIVFTEKYLKKNDIKEGLGIIFRSDETQIHVYFKTDYTSVFMKRADCIFFNNLYTFTQITDVIPKTYYDCNITVNDNVIYIYYLWEGNTYLLFQGPIGNFKFIKGTMKDVFAPKL